MPLDMRGETHRVFAHQALGPRGVPCFQCRDDTAVIGD